MNQVSLCCASTTGRKSHFLTHIIWSDHLNTNTDFFRVSFRLLLRVAHLCWRIIVFALELKRDKVWGMSPVHVCPVTRGFVRDDSQALSAVGKSLWFWSVRLETFSHLAALEAFTTESWDQTMRPEKNWVLMVSFIKLSWERGGWKPGFILLYLSRFYIHKTLFRKLEASLDVWELGTKCLCLMSVKSNFCSLTSAWSFHLLTSRCFFSPSSLLLSSILSHQHWKAEVGAVCAQWAHSHFCLHVRV